MRIVAYSVWMLWPSKVTAPEVGVVYPAISRDSVDLPAPDPPMMAVSVPGLAVSETFSSRFLSIDGEVDVAHLQAAGAGRDFVAADQDAAGEHQVDVADGHHVALVQQRGPDPCSR